MLAYKSSPSERERRPPSHTTPSIAAPAPARGPPTRACQPSLARAHRAPLAAHSPRGPRCLRLTPLLTHAADGEALYRHKAKKWKGGRGRLEMSEIGEEEGNMSRAALTRADRLASVPLWSMHKYSRSRGHLCLSTCGVVHARKRSVHQETCSCDDGALDGLQSDLVCIATSARWWRVPWREMRRERGVGPRRPQPSAEALF